MRVLVVAVAAFALVSVYPTLIGDVPGHRLNALFGMAFVLCFVVLGTVFAALIDESAVDLDDEALSIQFESFFHLVVPLNDIAAIRAIDPQPRWRYRLGLSTDWQERISCSHGGHFVEIELNARVSVRLWPRAVRVKRLWLGLVERDAFITDITARLDRRRLRPAA
jgi:hypothetical protein